MFVDGTCSIWIMLRIYAFMDLQTCSLQCPRWAALTSQNRSATWRIPRIYSLPPYVYHTRAHTYAHARTHARTRASTQTHVHNFAVTILRSSFEVPLKMVPIGCPEMPVTTNLRCVTFQKSGDFISYLVCYCW
jgi:hypothetical protein